jgi:hypothetical protein
MIGYHCTTAIVAAAILASGFRDGTIMGHMRRCIGGLALRGAWLVDRPLAAQSLPHQAVRLDTWLRVSVDLPEHALEDYELLVEDPPYRAWCIPAAVLNQHARVEPHDLHEGEARGPFTSPS